MVPTNRDYYYLLFTVWGGSFRSFHLVFPIVITHAPGQRLGVELEIPNYTLTCPLGQVRPIVLHWPAAAV